MLCAKPFQDKTPNQAFELLFTVADPDWTGTRLGFDLMEKENYTGAIPAPGLARSQRALPDVQFLLGDVSTDFEALPGIWRGGIL